MTEPSASVMVEPPFARRPSPLAPSRRIFSRMATYSISGVMMPAWAYSYWVTGRPGTPLKTRWLETSKRGARWRPEA